MRVFITGICGTLGSEIARQHKRRGDTVFGCTRSEATAIKYKASKDRDYIDVAIADASTIGNPDSSLYELVTSSTRVYHCAALKHVEICEKNPVEAVRENVTLTAIVSNVCHEYRTPIVFVSTDKACHPVGVYGATKLIAEKIVLETGGAIIRLGNLIGSSGSVFEKWASMKEKGERIKVTDPDMTRYFLPVKEAAEYLINSPCFGKVMAPRMKAARIGDIASAFGKISVIGPRPGETRHHYVIPPEEGGVSSEFAERWDIDELLSHVRKL